MQISGAWKLIFPLLLVDPSFALHYKSKILQKNKTVLLRHLHRYNTSDVRICRAFSFNNWHLGRPETPPFEEIPPRTPFESRPLQTKFSRRELNGTTFVIPSLTSWKGRKETGGTAERRKGADGGFVARMGGESGRVLMGVDAGTPIKGRHSGLINRLGTAGLR